jgi:hypothetical protein
MQERRPRWVCSIRGVNRSKQRHVANGLTVGWLMETGAGVYILNPPEVEFHDLDTRIGTWVEWLIVRS